MNQPRHALHTGAGVDPIEIARRTGHPSVAFIYDRYGHLFTEIENRRRRSWTPSGEGDLCSMILYVTLMGLLYGL
jgi:hypothetical protein